MNQLKAAIGCLALITVTLAPLALAHSDQNTYSGQGVAPLATGANRVSGVYYTSHSLLLGSAGSNGGTSATDFELGIASGLCDMEVLSDGSAAGAAEDEPQVDGAPGGTLAGTTFDDGGMTAVCHTPAGYYAHAAFNTGNMCDGYNAAGGNALADDLVSPHVWVNTVCSYAYSTGGSGLAGLAQACASSAVLSPGPNGPALDLADCALTVADCLVGGPLCPASPGSTITCGALNGNSNVAVSGTSGWDSAAFPSQTLFNNGATPAGTCPDTGATGSVFVWTAVVVDPTMNLVSVPTQGTIE